VWQSRVIDGNSIQVDDEATDADRCVYVGLEWKVSVCTLAYWVLGVVCFHKWKKLNYLEESLFVDISSLPNFQVLL